MNVRKFQLTSKWIVQVKCISSQNKIQWQSRRTRSVVQLAQTSLPVKVQALTKLVIFAHVIAGKHVRHGSGFVAVPLKKCSLKRCHAFLTT